MSSRPARKRPASAATAAALGASADSQAPVVLKNPRIEDIDPKALAAFQEIVAEAIATHVIPVFVREAEKKAAEQAAE